MSNDKQLNDKQLGAIQYLLAGQSQTETAELVDVDKATLWRWMQKPEFIAALNFERNEIHSANREYLRSLTSKAIGVLDKLMDSKNEATKHRAAIAILDKGGSMGTDDTDTNPDHIAARQAAWKAAESIEDPTERLLATVFLD